MQRILPVLGVTVLGVLLGGSVSQAQVGGGSWTSTSPSYKTQNDGNVSINGNQFSIRGGGGGEQRAERRYATFSSGIHQFEGRVRVNSLGGDRICLKQTFMQDRGPWNMIAVKKPGELYEVATGNTLARYVIGSTVRINTVTNANSGRVAVYINGSQVETRTGGSGGYYDKYGAYRTNSGRGPVSVTWSGVRFWRR